MKNTDVLIAYLEFFHFLCITRILSELVHVHISSTVLFGVQTFLTIFRIAT